MRTQLLEVFLPGRPVPQGSLLSFKHPTTKQVLTPQTPSVLKWRAGANRVLKEAWGDRRPAQAGRVELRALFVYERPKCHFYEDKKRKGQLREEAPEFPIGREYADLDKLVRAVGDVLSKVVLQDDSQICELTTEKTFGSPAGVLVRIFHNP